MPSVFGLHPLVKNHLSRNGKRGQIKGLLDSFYSQQPVKSGDGGDIKTVEFEAPKAYLSCTVRSCLGLPLSLVFSFPCCTMPTTKAINNRTFISLWNRGFLLSLSNAITPPTAGWSRLHYVVRWAQTKLTFLYHCDSNCAWFCAFSSESWKFLIATHHMLT